MKRRIDQLEGDSGTGNKRRRTDRQRVSIHGAVGRNAGSDNANQNKEPAPTTLSEPSAELPENQRFDEQFASNPLVSPSRYVKHTGRRQRAWRTSGFLISTLSFVLTSVVFLGPTSTWSFSRRVLSNIRDRLNPDRSVPIPLAVDGDAYQIHWRCASSDELPDISGLPSLEYAIFLLNAVKFRLSPLYRLFDEEEFLQNLHAFYDNATAKAQESRLWYVQYLVVMAFGEALLVPVRTASNTAPWTKYFTRAMSLLPDTTRLWNEPTLAIETLALIALYFHSVDMRDTAYCYVRSPIAAAELANFGRSAMQYAWHWWKAIIGPCLLISWVRS